MLEGGAGVRVYPHCPQIMTLYPAPQSSHLTEEVQILVTDSGWPIEA